MINVVLNIKDNISKTFDDIDKKAKETEKNTTKSFKKIGAAIAIAGAAAALVITKIVQMTREYAKMEQQVRTTFGTTGDVMKEQIGLIKSLAATYDGDFNEILKSSNALAKEFGISTSHALGLVKRGFEVGANANGEFLDILKEYPAQMKSVGISAEETIAIITQQAKEGVFSDKGIDAIKEAGLRLREMNKGTKESIQFLGMQTAEEIDLAIAKGDTFKAIQLVSKGLKETELSASEAQKIISNVFGGPGEDAGRRYLETLADFNTELSDMETTASLVTIAQQGMIDKWEVFKQSIISGSGPISQAISKWYDRFAAILDFATNINKGFNFKQAAELTRWKEITTTNFEEKLRNDIDSKIAGGMSKERATKYLGTQYGTAHTQTKQNAKNFLNQKKELEKQIDDLKWWQKNGYKEAELNKQIKAIDNQLIVLNEIGKSLKTKEMDIKNEYLGVGGVNDPINDPINDPLKTGNLTGTKPSSFGSQNKVSEITIHVEKQIETVNINSGENIQSLKDQLQRLLTEIVVDANQFGLR